MPSVELTALWVNSAGDPSDYRSLSLAAFVRTDDVPGDVRLLAGGRVRFVRTFAGSRTSLAATLSRPTLDDLAWLRARIGAPLYVRDPDGGKFAAVLLDLPVTRTPNPARENVDVTFEGITHSEAV
jgi:hypothetical protein